MAYTVRNIYKLRKRETTHEGALQLKCRSHTIQLFGFINNANCWNLVCILLCSSHYRLNTYFTDKRDQPIPSPLSLRLGSSTSTLTGISTSNGWHDTGTPTVTVPDHAPKSAQRQGRFARYKGFQCLINTWDWTHAQHVAPQQRAGCVTIVVSSSVLGSAKINARITRWDH